LIVHRARWVLPIVAPPIREGWVAVDRGLIVAVGGPQEQAPAAPVPPRSEALLPGLVNAHTHLELSWLRGKVPPAGDMPTWAQSLIARRRAASADPVEPIHEAVREARVSGTTLVGDIGNTSAAYDPLRASDLSAVVFRELIGFGGDPEPLVRAAVEDLAALTPTARLRPVLVPHAPYSVSTALFRNLAARAGDRPFSVHVGESAQELELLARGEGAWRTLLERLGAWNEQWTAPACGPVGYLDSLGVVNDRLLAVHCVHVTDPEMDRLAAAGATIVACPRSNRWTGAGNPPIERFYRSGVRVAVGTDSLASVDDLNVFAELAAMRRLAPFVPASALLRSATLNGALALGFDDELGSIEPGKRAELIAVRVPEGVDDVEEYLVEGIEADAIRWVES
jgi:cytosine/adenosine deaminase-related metal-dependent hydrolase